MPPSEHGHDSLDIGQNYVAFSCESAEFGLNRCKDTTFQRFIQMYKPEILCKYQSIGSVEPTVEPTSIHFQNRSAKSYNSFLKLWFICFKIGLTGIMIRSIPY